MIKRRAIILAAGRGSRLVDNGPLPKPLVPLKGRPLLERILTTLMSEGVREAVIVTGYKGDLIRKSVKTWPDVFPMDIQFVENDEWQRANGVSLLKARPYVDEHCLLSMSDHMFSPSMVRLLQCQELDPAVSMLAIDRKIPKVYDLDDATKVLCNGIGILDIGKQIPEYDAIDTGLFCISRSLTDALYDLYLGRGDCSLSDGVKSLCEKGLMEYCDVGEAFWVDVDTLHAHRFAESMLDIMGDQLEGPAQRAWARLPAGEFPLARAAVV
jgi:choline kinase